ncbi:MAG TPA: hypothetical protein VMV69_19110 [Pirellulales bacterium]|nr:hypothetical protein [Pirellulales bacterium]
MSKKANVHKKKKVEARKPCDIDPTSERETGTVLVKTFPPPGGSGVT